MPLRGPEAYFQRTSFAIFMRASARTQCARNHQRVVCGAQGGEQVVGLLELDARLLGDLLAVSSPNFGERSGRSWAVPLMASSRTGVGVLHAVEGEVDLRQPGRDDLAQADWGRVLQVGAAHHDDVVELLGLLSSVARWRTRGYMSCSFGDNRDVHGGVKSFEDRPYSRGYWGARGLGAQPPASSMARLEMTFVGVHVRLQPEPVCRQTSGKLSSSLPEMTSSPACAM